jgi:hypothetical protein
MLVLPRHGEESLQWGVDVVLQPTSWTSGLVKKLVLHCTGHAVLLDTMVAERCFCTVRLVQNWAPLSYYARRACESLTGKSELHPLISGPSHRLPTCVTGLVTWVLIQCQKVSIWASK